MIMDLGKLNLFIKMVEEEYQLSDSQISVLSRRLLADEKEFERAWKSHKEKGLKFRGGVDHFKSLLSELLA